MKEEELSIPGYLHRVLVERSFVFMKNNRMSSGNKRKKLMPNRKKILDSIHYAKRMQRPLFPSNRFIEKTLEAISKLSFSTFLPPIDEALGKRWRGGRGAFWNNFEIASSRLKGDSPT